MIKARMKFQVKFKQKRNRLEHWKAEFKKRKGSEFPMLRPLAKALGPFLEGGRVAYEISTSIISARNPFTGQPQPGTRHYNALLAELAPNLTAL